MILFLVCLLIILLFSYTTESFENIKKQQCRVLVDSFPNISECQYFTNIKNKDNVKKNGVNKDNYIIMNTKVKDQDSILYTNYYPMNKEFKKETSNCKQLIGWIFDYCRFKL
jgi:hypothetical protein